MTVTLAIESHDKGASAAGGEIGGSCMGAVMIHQIDRFIAQPDAFKHFFHLGDAVSIVKIRIKEPIAIPTDAFAEQTGQDPPPIFLFREQISQNDALQLRRRHHCQRDPVDLFWSGMANIQHHL